MKRYTLLLFSLIFVFNQVYCQELRNKEKESSNFDSLITISRKNILTYKKTSEILKEKIEVTVIETCSTDPNLCGFIVTGSYCLVKLMSGQFIGDTLIIASTCERTNYLKNITYFIKPGLGPDFSVHLCSGEIYNPNWNINLQKNKYRIYFGTLERKGFN
jgi:hypothetical protein